MSSKKHNKHHSSQQRSTGRLALQVLLSIATAGFFTGVKDVEAVSTITDGSGGGHTYEAGADNTFNIYAQQIKGSNAINQFSQFSLGENDIANLYFRTTQEGADVANLLNFVDAQISINGTVNAIQGGLGGQNGGNLFFLSPNGMAVGANGAINAGSLYVIAPTDAEYGTLKTNFTTNDSADVSTLTSGTVPLSGSSTTISVLGTISASNVTLAGGSVTLGENNTTVTLSTTGDIILSAANSITNNEAVTAGGSVSMNSTGTITNNANVSAASAITMNAGTAIDNSTGGDITISSSGGNITLTAGTSIINDAVTATNGAISMDTSNGSGSIENTGAVTAGTTLTEKAKTTLTNSAAVKAATGITMEAGNSISNGSTVEATGGSIGMTATNNGITNTGAVTATGESSSVSMSATNTSAGAIQNDANVTAGNGITMTAGTTIDNSNNSLLVSSAKGGISLTAGTSITNDAVTASAGSVSMTANKGNITNNGALQALGTSSTVNLTAKDSSAGAITNNANVTAGNGITMTAEQPLTTAIAASSLAVQAATLP